MSTKQYVGEPINCWVPAQFTESHEEYANKICWVSNTYYLPFRTKQLPERSEPRTRIGYYQWIPMILLCQSVLFFLPCVVWRILNRRAGINIRAIVDAAITCQRSVALADTRDKSIRFMVNHLDGYLGATIPEPSGSWDRIKRSLAKRCLFICGKTYGNYLNTMYLLTKLLYISNAVGQLFMLNVFLGTDYHMFGVYVVSALFRGQVSQLLDREGLALGREGTCAATGLGENYSW